jgi:hypothetical protein
MSDGSSGKAGSRKNSPDLFFQLVSSRYEHASLILTSNLRRRRRGATCCELSMPAGRHNSPFGKLVAPDGGCVGRRGVVEVASPVSKLCSKRASSEAGTWFAPASSRCTCNVSKWVIAHAAG